MTQTLTRTFAAGAAMMLAASSLYAQATPGSTLFGVTFFGNELISVDRATGAALSLGTLSSTAVNGYGIATRNGSLYTFDPNKNLIRQISRVSGKIVKDFDVGLTNLQGEGDLAFRKDGVGFLASALDKNGVPTNDLYTFDLDKGTSSRLGSTGVAIDGMAFDSTGTLYAVGEGDAMLYRIDQASGATTTVGSLGVDMNSPISGIAFDTNDVLYASIDDRLHTINKATGAATPVSADVLDFGFSSVSGLTATSGAAALGNVSSRINVQKNENVGIAGFIVRGTTSQRILVRGIGPSLSKGGVTTPLADPMLQLFDAQGKSLASNDDWKTSQQSDINATNLAPGNDRESAILMTLAPGTYTAILSGKNSGTGIGLVEVYNLDLGSGADLINISTRGLVQSSDSVMIGGVIVRGSAAKQTIVRAIGPDLTKSGVQTPLADPTLEVRDASGTLVASNDNWKATQQNEIAATSLAPGDDKDAALLVSLPPGNYTAIVAGANNSSGVGLLEVYDLNPATP